MHMNVKSIKLTFPILEKFNQSFDWNNPQNHVLNQMKTMLFVLLLFACKNKIEENCVFPMQINHNIFIKTVGSVHYQYEKKKINFYCFLEL